MSILVFILGKWSERNKDAKQRITQEKIAVYKKFIDHYFGIFSQEKVTGVGKTQGEIMAELFEFQRELISWGSDSVITAYADHREKLINFSGHLQPDKQETAKQLAAVLKSVANLIAAMRRDIGYPFTSFDAKKLAAFQLATDEETRKIFDHL